MTYLFKMFSIIVIILPISYSQASQNNIEFVSIPAATFIMGTSDLEDALIEIPPDSPIPISDEQPAHNVFISPFEIGKYEVTQQQWFALMGTKPGPNSHWQHQKWKMLPVVSVSWEMTQQFIQKLNADSRQYHYRLPTEAEFEFVLRDGSTELRPFEVEDMDNYAWTITNSKDTPQPVGQLMPNSFGVYDTFGNAWEWVNDWYRDDAYAKHSKSNPKVKSNLSNKKVRRGGSYHCAAHIVRSGYRAADKPTQRYSVLGFRLVREKR